MVSSQASPSHGQPPPVGFSHQRTDSQDSDGLYATSPPPPRRSASQGSEGLYSPTRGGVVPPVRRTDSQGSEGLYSPTRPGPPPRRTDSQESERLYSPARGGVVAPARRTDSQGSEGFFPPAGRPHARRTDSQVRLLPALLGVIGGFAVAFLWHGITLSYKAQGIAWRRVLCDQPPAAGARLYCLQQLPINDKCI